ncbi:MAG TPA: hypothetical protein VLJ19_09640 [Variovorax sp.]|nr:hypothetical protein [Variovorax sp.]
MALDFLQHATGKETEIGSKKTGIGAGTLQIGQFVMKRPAHAVLLTLALTGCAVSPQPFDAQQNKDRASDLIQRVAADQEPVSAPIDLYEAMARAIRYNLDARVEMMSLALSQRELDLTTTCCPRWSLRWTTRGATTTRAAPANRC